MSRPNRILVGVILLELVAGWFLTRPRSASEPPEPPLPDLSLADPVAAVEIRHAVEQCRTAEQWRSLGELLMGHGFFSEAEMCHRVACEREPNNPLLTYQWAFALERLALLDEANEQYRRAIQLGYTPADDCRYFIARNLLRAEKAAEARTVFEEGKALPACRYELARLHYRAGELPQAVELLDGLTALAPKAIQPHQYLYRIALDRGDRRTAFAEADQVWWATQKMPTPFDKEYTRLMTVWQTTGVNGRCQECQGLIQQGKLPDAEAKLTELLAQRWQSHVVDLMAEVAFQKGEPSKAIRLLDEIVTRDGPSAHVFIRIGDTWEAMGNPEKARENWLRAVQLSNGRDLKDIHFKIAQSYGRAGNKPRADEHMAQAYSFAGLEMLRSSRYPEALTAFESSVKLAPKLASSWFDLGETRRQLGQTAAAREAYRTCLSLNPYHGRAIAVMAYLAEPGK